MQGAALYLGVAAVVLAGLLPKLAGFVPVAVFGACLASALVLAIAPPGPWGPLVPRTSR